MVFASTEYNTPDLVLLAQKGKNLVNSSLHPISLLVQVSEVGFLKNVLIQRITDLYEDSEYRHNEFPALILHMHLH